MHETLSPPIARYYISGSSAWVRAVRVDVDSGVFAPPRFLFEVSCFDDGDGEKVFQLSCSARRRSFHPIQQDSDIRRPSCWFVLRVDGVEGYSDLWTGQVIWSRVNYGGG